MLQLDQARRRRHFQHFNIKLTQPFPVLLHKASDRGVIGVLAGHQPNHVKAVVTRRFLLPARTQPVHRAIDVQDRQVPRLVGWLAFCQVVFRFPVLEGLGKG